MTRPFTIQHLQVVPVSYQEACVFVRKYHRHHKPPQGHKFSIGLANENGLVGVAIVGRPVARLLDNGYTAEVTRLCTDGTKNACSMLYAACWRAARAMGYRELITYILETEKGTSLNAAGWKCLGKAGGGTWDRLNRSRKDDHPLQAKIKFSISDE